MSWTNKGSKAPGYDFWSKRPCSKLGSGSIVKDMTHRRERSINKNIVRTEMKEYTIDC